MKNRPYEEVDYDLFLAIAEKESGQRAQGKGLATKVLFLARQERIALEPLNPAPINDLDLLRVYTHYARPEQKDMAPAGLGESTFSILRTYLERRYLLSEEDSS